MVEREQALLDAERELFEVLGVLAVDRDGDEPTRTGAAMVPPMVPDLQLDAGDHRQPLHQLFL